MHVLRIGAVGMCGWCDPLARKEGRADLRRQLGVFTVPDGMSYMLISDGMGSGREAATASRIAVEFLRRMLGCGIVRAARLIC